MDRLQVTPPYRTNKTTATEFGQPTGEPLSTFEFDRIAVVYDDTRRGWTRRLSFLLACGFN
jgi:hypothetical protein